MSYQLSDETNAPHLLGTDRAAKRRAVGRFAPTPGLRAVRAANRVLCRVAPALAARLAYRQLATPPRSIERDWQVTLRADARRHMLPFGRGHLAVCEWGAGPAVLMVHGWGSHATHMGRMVAPLVRAGFRVVSFDAPAHGESSGRATDLVQFASAIAAVAAYAGPLHGVLAHSFGASMAMYAWRDWGVEPERMVLLSSFKHCNWFVDAFGEHAALTPNVLSRVRDRLVRLYGGRLDWSRMSVTDMVRAMDFPALIVHDENDDEIPFEHGLSLAAASKLASFSATRGQGHHLVVRNPEVIRSVVRFLSADA
jgi:pimeloyl-ACP methyl ester carboxylesterase